MPLFSVVIPTYNRAGLLQYALQGALEQTFDDYEIIVSDNCSTDNTRQVVADLDSKRVCYLKPEKHMNLADHWDFAVRHAKGRYIMMLGDDDCMTPNMLGTLSPLAQSGKANLVSYAVGRYYHPNYFKPALRNQLQIKPFTGQLLEIDALEELKRWHFLRNYFVPPPSALISHKIIETVTVRAGRFFFNPYPDYCASAMVFSFGGNFTHVDHPRLAFGRSTKSLGEIVFGGSAWALDKRMFEKKSSVKWFEEELDDLYELVPLKGAYFSNGFAESLLKAGRALPDQFSSFELSWATYYVKYHLNMQIQRMNGFNIEDDDLEFWEAVSRLPDGPRKEVQKSVRANAVKSAINRQLSRLYRGSCQVRTLRPIVTKLREMALGDNQFVVHGDDAGFSNILECARQLETICSTIGPSKEVSRTLVRGAHLK